ncbi:SLC13 family permease [Streptomyces scopuliridis]|uniref:SLC13 family permease n=1 Tax=Streptomyces scopuliridis TaxID=452529 RepID=A0ACD4ZWY6_9ACTN|nr:SLC13 family permease [Streptomyces scopuliridis]WSB38089.1 SLC13 family permease [Streptomyces scopuliridis]WSC02522.1 SLC13 family permease [Streptomyces scopuliridis]WSC03946.1 SLC13 family permease [Streptomyces scopuliridis]
MSAELISILVLAVVFVIATTRSINMGALAFAAAFGVGGLVAGLDADGIFAGFPGDLFVVLVGVTYLFAIARANGTTDWLVHAAIRLVRGRIALIPWVMFAITGALTAIGAVSPAAVAIVAPIALSFAAQYGISPLLMGAMVVHGAQGGGFSPISIYGSIVNGIVERENLPGSELTLFLGSLVANLVIAGIVFVLFGGLKLSGRRGEPEQKEPQQTEQEQQGQKGQKEKDERKSEGQRGSSRLTPAIGATLAALVALVVAVLGFDLDAGLSSITLAVLLSAVWPDTSRKAVGEIAWPTVLLICGVLTYVGVMEEMGTIDYAGHAVGDIGIPLLAAVLLCYIGAIVSAFASSVGIMGALIPLAVPFLAQGEIGAIGMITALAISATVVDVSPFSTNGALVLAAAPDVDRERFFRQLMVYGGIVVAVVPAAVWLVLVVPGFG